MSGRLFIDDVSPVVSLGRFPAKAVVGEALPVEATVWREGHEALAAAVLWTGPDGTCREIPLRRPDPEGDRWRAVIVPEGTGECAFRVRAWTDPWQTWLHAVEARREAGLPPGGSGDPEAGARLLEEAARLLTAEAEPRGGAGAGLGAAPAAGAVEAPHEEALPRPADAALDSEAGDGAAGPGAVRATAAVLGSAAEPGFGGCHAEGVPGAGGLLAADAALGAGAGATAPRSVAAPGLLLRAAGALRGAADAEGVSAALGPAVRAAMERHPLRALAAESPAYRVRVERRRALYGSWYEFFPRSTGGRAADGTPRHGTFRTAVGELPRIARMGFDVVYLPPIHPIGTTARKGRDNALSAAPGDVGSPWAIGSADGGHDAVHPELGTLEDFDAFVAAARRAGLEVAMDLALQCAPDHPWLRDHPEWFTHRPDGTIACAENPPKTYEDIVPLNFDNDPEGLYAEILRVVRFWTGRGVRVFRVDNPHTKPPDFWHRLIRDVRSTEPDVLFLAEAFTRPAVQHGLSKLGFSQSYTYFTWKTDKRELTDYLTELTGEAAAWFRPNFFVNTPDILPVHLQSGQPAVFALRAALAATLSPSWGVYSGYELYESDPLVPGEEEYRASEKYELRPRDHTAAGPSLEPWITLLNTLRRRHPALQQLRSLHFHDTDNDRVLVYSKHDPVSGDTVLCAVTLTPDETEQTTVRLDTAALGLEPGRRVHAVDEVTGRTAELGPVLDLKIDPQQSVAHVFTWSDQ
ncbi:maltotransferase domain-containing protein [Streptomyces sp. NPDC045431]|uniref:maltotransferase domain-containing protein n=1 Tax=Streptomyces sp. NPDC045431 TaxID=3155613 RepID=UPI0033C5568F